MASSCISSCMNDVVAAAHLPLRRFPATATLIDQREPLVGESGRKFTSFEERCYRQLYLRSYTFRRKETFRGKAKRRIRNVLEGVKRRRLTNKAAVKRKKKMMCLRKVRKLTYAVLLRILRRVMMNCTTRVDTTSD